MDLKVFHEKLKAGEILCWICQQVQTTPRTILFRVEIDEAEYYCCIGCLPEHIRLKKAGHELAVKIDAILEAGAPDRSE